MLSVLTAPSPRQVLLLTSTPETLSILVGLCFRDSLSLWKRSVALFLCPLNSPLPSHHHGEVALSLCSSLCLCLLLRPVDPTQRD